MRYKPVRILLILSLLITCIVSPIPIFSQDITAEKTTGNSPAKHKLTDEVLFVRASSASVIQWLGMIEKQKGISISFNFLSTSRILIWKRFAL